jgi:hypothetical protein
VTFETTADPVGKALWYIETHFASELTLDDIAGASDLSRYHLSRAFPEVTGSGVEVASFDNISDEFATLRIPQHRYAVFTHKGNISTIQATWAPIFRTGLPELGAQVADAPDFEKYDERFDPRSGSGIAEIWMPLA